MVDALAAFVLERCFSGGILLGALIYAIVIILEDVRPNS